MIIPHVAVVSSVLLAGNNPSSWAGVASSLPRAHPNDSSRSPTSTTLRRSSTSTVRDFSRSSSKWLRDGITILYKPTYPCVYNPAWLWNRGTNKAMWLSKLAEENPGLSCLKEEVLHLGLKKWLLFCILPAIFLLIVPGMLGIMIRYGSPTPVSRC
jgi:hypothetical protein